MSTAPGITLYTALVTPSQTEATTPRLPNSAVHHVNGHAAPESHADTAREALSRFIADRFDDPYMRYHAPRYANLLDLLCSYYQLGDTLLEIGPSTFSRFLSDHFRTGVDTLGFAADGRTDQGRHISFDLNDAHDRADWRADLPVWNHVIFAEVLEHLYTAPGLILAFIWTLVAPNGRVYLQTPNAAAMHKRLRLLCGRNPYMPIREDRHDPGHFREYTSAEIEDYVTAAGFTVEQKYYANYFDLRHAHRRPGSRMLESIVHRAYALMPPTLRTGMTFVLRKPGSS